MKYGPCGPSILANTAGGCPPPPVTASARGGVAPLLGTPRPGGVAPLHAALRAMAAEIHSRPQSRRPVLLSKVEGHQDAVSAALLIPKEDGVITAGEDR